jgi:hypothetical protein
VLHNLLIGRHTHPAAACSAKMFFTRKVPQAEVEAREKVER